MSHKGSPLQRNHETCSLEKNFRSNRHITTKIPFHSSEVRGTLKEI